MTPDAPSDIEDIYPLSPMQHGMLFHSLLDPSRGLYLQQVEATLEGPLDADLLAQAWTSIARRHPVLRTSFVWEGLDEPLQVVHRSAGVPVTLRDVSALDEEAQQAAVQAFLREDRVKGLDLREAPLMRVALLKLSEREHHLVWTFHHILFDGWSAPILLKEVFGTYRATIENRTLELPPARPYSDFISWLRDRDAASEERDWRARLRGFAEPTPLPVAPPAVVDVESPPRELEAALDEATSLRLQDLARRHRLTLSTLAQAAWGVVLSRYSGRDDVVFGVTVSGRPPELPGADGIVGLFINTLPLRLRVPSATPVRAWLDELQRVQSEFRHHEHTSLAKIQAWSEVPRGQPLFESILVFENFPTGYQGKARTPSDLALRGKGTRGRTNYPVTLTIVPHKALSLRIAHDPARMDADAAQRMLSHLRTVLASLAAAPPDAPLGSLRMLPEDEERAVLAAAAGPARDYPREPLSRVVAEWAARTPDATAVVDGDARVSYADLVARAGGLASRLRASGVAAGDVVGVCMPRGVDAVASVLGALMAGAAYLPLDPALPPERLRGMVEDARAKLVLTHARHEDALPSALPRLLLDRLPPHDGFLHEPAPPEAPAYVVFTSGSTGAPKGAVVTNASLTNAMHAWRERYGLEPGGAHLQMAGLSFDVFTGDLARALGSGGTLVVCPRDHLLEPWNLAALLVRERVRYAEFVPSVLRALHAHLRETGTTLPDVRVLVAGSDAWFVPEHAEMRERFGPGTRVINSFGVTEATIDTTFFEGAPIRGGADAMVPIGKPFPNMRAYVLDAERRLMPVGVAGELYLGGAGVAQGYVGRPDLTAERFLDDPYAPGGRLYRTGDCARLLPDGNLEFLGRLDHQVKLRGHRIEPGEIEAVLARHALVREAVVVLLGAGADARLVAYVVPDGAAPTHDDLRAHVARHLPAHMVPSALVTLDAMPLTPNGKVDRRRLPAPEAPAPRAAAPQELTPTEEILAQAWVRALGVPHVHPEDDFFALGGHSLVATQAIAHARAAFHVDVPLRALFASPTLRGFAREVDALRGRAPAEEAPPIAPVPRDAPLQLSFAQERLWFLQEWAPQSAAYNVVDPYRIAGALDASALGQAVDDVVARHEALRTTLHRRGEGPVQVVHPASPGALRVVDHRGLAPDARLDAARRAGAEEASTPFDLSTQAFRARLLAFADDDHALVLAVHHAMYDGWSSAVLLRDLQKAYAARAAGQEPAWDAPALQYADHAAWQRAHVAGDRLARQLDHWRQALRDAPVLDLPVDKPRPPRPTYRGGRVAFALGAALTRKVQEASRKEGATPFMTLTAAFHALLHRWTRQDDVVVGTPVHGRTRPELQDAVGCFVNALPLRVRFADRPTFAQVLSRVRDAFLDAHANQDVPFERIVEAVDPARDPSRPPLCQAMIVQQLPGSPRQDARAWTPLPIARATAKFDLTLGVGDTPDGLKGAIEFNADVLEEASAARLARAFQSLLAAALDDLDAPVAALPLLDEAGRRREVEDWNPKDAPYPADATIPALFAEAAARAPHAVAVVGDGRATTYEALDRASDALAAALLAEGVQRGDLVGLCAERDARMVTAMLAILKAGAGYVPLDPSYPQDRLAWMVRDAGARVVVAGEGLHKLLPDAARIVPLDARASAMALPRGAATDPAYVIYTSGSTGTPKGIVVPHRAVARLVRGTDYVQLGPGDVVAQASNASFDAATFEVWGALLNGARLVLVDKETLLTPPRLAEALRKESVTTLFVTTALFNQTVRERPDAFSTLRELLFGGEAVDPRAVRTLLQGAPPARLLHVYGPTETTTFATWHPVTAVPDDAWTVPIGKPIANTRAYVLDERMQPVPQGVHGELYVGGPGVALGYHERPDLTRERFVADPFVPGARLYRTGDVVRRDARGDLQFVGRLDGQVKVRGFRIELGEIEAALLAEPDVAEAVAVVREDEPGRKEIVAYVTLRGGDAGEALRARLRRRLPDHLVPSAVVPLPALPLNPNGKIDRRALPAPERRSTDAATRALTPDEARLAALWRDVLRVDAVGAEDDFFALGGQSLLATQLASRIRETFQVDLPLRDVFACPRLVDMAQAVAAAPKTDATPGIRRVQREGYRIRDGGQG